jgi:hypothetical protein
MDRISEIISQENTGIIFLVALLLLIGAVAKWRMFLKCNQPGIASIVPIWDVVVVLRIVGRPAWHIFFFLIPVFNIYFGLRVLIEVAQSFGKNSVVDYAFVIVFNLFYLLNLGLAYNEEYQGPVYKVSPDELKQRASRYATA